MVSTRPLAARLSCRTWIDRSERLKRKVDRLLFRLLSSPHLTYHWSTAWTHGTFKSKLTCDFRLPVCFSKRSLTIPLTHELKPLGSLITDRRPSLSSLLRPSTGQGSVKSLRHQLDHGQSLTETAKPDLTGFCRT